MTFWPGLGNPRIEMGKGFSYRILARRRSSLTGQAQRGCRPSCDAPVSLANLSYATKLRLPGLRADLEQPCRRVGAACGALLRAGPGG